LSRLATSFVLGYHGCDEAVARRAVLEGVDLLHSDHDYDWLGPGAYFWESDPVRAREWADEKVSAGRYTKAAVVGAVIDLGNCLDLVSRADIELLRWAYGSFVETQTHAGLSIPENRKSKSSADTDWLLRFLDCAVIKHLHNLMQDAEKPAFDTVRGMFVEGGRAFAGSGIYRKSHVQIAVRNPACIKGLFFPLPRP
jgi:hypothetical protein